MINLSNLIHKVWKDERVRELRLRKSDVDVVVKVLVEHIVSNLLEYGKVKMQGLFSLDIRRVKGRKSIHPKTKKSIHIDDYYKVGLKPSKNLKDGLRNLK